MQRNKVTQMHGGWGEQAITIALERAQMMDVADKDLSIKK